MSIQLSILVRNAMLDAIETTIGVSAIVKFFTGSPPANCAAVDTGTKLVEFDLASDWAANAASGSKSFNNTPVSATAVATGTAGYYRVYASDGTTCGKQGTITATAGGGDLTVDNTSITNGQTVQLGSWTITEPGA